MAVFLVKNNANYTLPGNFDKSLYVYFPSAPFATYTIAGVTFSFDIDEIPTIGGVLKNLGDAFTVGGQTYLYVAKGSVVGAPISAPGAPTAVSAVAGNAQATVSFTAPAVNGGGAITGYTVTSSPGNITASGSSSPIVVTGLTNGVAYTFTVTATNAAGVGTASSASSAVTPSAPVPPPPSGGGGGPPEIIPCFFGNARVLTPGGYRRMDSLKEGDMVQTPAGTSVAIERVKRYACEAGPTTNPFVIPAGKFGAEHRVLISPDHKVCLADGRRVAAKALGLEQEMRVGQLIYYNLELTGEADMVVSGVAVESLAHVRRMVLTMDQFVTLMAKKYGGELSAATLAHVKRTCRMLADGRVEIPVARR
jgi:hypothetical protein